MVIGLINYTTMKSSNIITIIVAFLIGILVAMALNPAGDDTNLQDEDKTEDAMEESTDEGEDQAEAAPATTTTTTTTASSPKPVNTGSCVPGISGYKDAKLNAIVLNWSTCPSDDFQFYKILKSSINPNPSYPADPVVVSSSNKNLANHVDKTIAVRTTYYYRACVIQRLGKVGCGNIISVAN